MSLLCNLTNKGFYKKVQSGLAHFWLQICLQNMVNSQKHQIGKHNNALEYYISLFNLIVLLTDGMFFYLNYNNLRKEISQQN